MIPILFPAAETAYSSHGIGPIADATSCTVEEELNGAYTLRLTVPPTTPRLADLKSGAQILARANPYDQTQPFRIQRVSKRLSGELEIYAPHLCYDLARAVINPASYPFSAASVAEEITLMNSAQTPAVFTFAATGNLPRETSNLQLDQPLYAWDMLTPPEPSGETPWQAYSAEPVTTLGANVYHDLRFDRRLVQLVEHRGENRGYQIVYGRNMTELSIETDGEDFYTGYLPVYTGSGGLRVGTLREYEVDYGYKRILLADCTDMFSARPSVAALNTAANRRYGYGFGQLRVQTRIGLVPPGSRGLKTLEDLRLGDTVRVVHEGMGVQIEARIVKTSWDALAEKYRSVDVEGCMTGAAETIAKIAKYAGRDKRPF